MAELSAPQSKRRGKVVRMNTADAWEGGLASISKHTQVNKAWFLGFGLYWTWVYLSFNSATVVSFANGDEVAITWLHVLSGLSGCITFILALFEHRRLEGAGSSMTVIWAAATIASFGSMFYATEVVDDAFLSLALGAVLPGIATPLMALGWGVLFCTLDARWAAGLTAGSFMLSGILYGAISLIPGPLSGVIVAFLPLASALMMALCPNRGPHPFTMRSHAPSAEKSRISELKGLLCGPFSSRALIGITLTMVVSGGLRTYTGLEAPAVYHDPFIVSLSTFVVAALFLVYSAFVPHTSLKLGPLYRIAAPLFAIGIAALTVFNEPDSGIAYFAASAGSMFIDMLTWVLLIEIARSSRLSALVIFAVGRFAIHAGMAAGEILALAFSDMMVAFCVSSIVILVVVAGFMFSDRDSMLVFEPVEEGEIAPQQSESNEDAAAPTMDDRIASVAEKFGLTAREKEVFTLWATGHGAKSIEEKLVLSSATVRTHIRHIYEKLDVHSRAELIELLETI